MSQERTELTLADLAPWLALAALVVAGIVFYFWLAPGTAPVVEPVAMAWSR
jgi:hypothetical protein